MKFKSIKLFGKTLFKWATIESPVQLLAPMPANEACFVYVLKGECINYSETDEIRAVANQALLSKCGSNSFKVLAVEGSTEYSAVSIHFHKKVLEKIYDKSVPPFFKNKQSPIQVNCRYQSSSHIKTRCGSLLKQNYGALETKTP